MDNCIYYDKFYDKNILISGSEDGSIFAWDLLDDKLTHNFKVENLISENTSINNVTINENGILAISGFPEYDNIIFYKITLNN